MDSISPALRIAVLLLVMGGVAGFGQSTLPPTSPTVAAPAASSPTVSSPAAAVNPPHRASVVYSGGQLEVKADNSSLNQILRDISRYTGMKITGGVTDERVFGKYGPAGASEVLAKLLDGTDTNMLLKETADKTPAELILTSRQGGPSPPNPSAPGFDDEIPYSDSVEGAPVQAPPPLPVSRTDPATPQPAPQGPGGPGQVRTPQEIYQQLQQLQLQQQQQQQQANPR